jgi:hypothetical protein
MACHGLSILETEFLPSASFPARGDTNRIRQIFADDLSVNRLGLGSSRQDAAIHFAFPIVILVGRTGPVP